MFGDFVGLALKGLKNQSQRFMTISGQSCIEIKTLRYFRVRSSALESKSKNTRNKMDKRRPRVALKVLGAMKEQFPDTKQFIEDLIDEECLKEKIFADEVIFLQV